MNFNEHGRLKGEHAFLSASKYHWLNYDPEKLESVYLSSIAAERGSRLHALAAELISLGIKLPRNTKTLNMYVNDAIGYRMSPEVVLYYSDNCFGTTDSISFNKNLLRIHDLKTGSTPVHMEQLRIYMALFCLEYGVRPGDIDAELRLYFQDEIITEEPEVDEIAHIMDKIISFDKKIELLKEEYA